MKVFIARILLVFSFLLSSAFIGVHAATPDGSGPWADEVVSSSQGLTKAGAAVPLTRSDPTSTLGIAEDNTTEGNFFSLGFGGTITLRFDNPISDGVIVVEATNDGYPTETATIELSSDGTAWVSAGTITQDGSVDMPDTVSCVMYIRITDTSNPDNFSEDTADAYDVDGVQATGGESCATVTPTPTQTLTPTPTPTDNGNNNGGNNNNSGGNNNSNSNQCSDSKPPTPSLNSVTRSGSTATLAWSAVSPASHYSISYGTSPGSYAYGVPNTGNVTTFVVGGLNPSANYYFVVRAVNGCTAGDPSGENSTGSGNVLGASTGGQVLGASTDTLAATGSNISYLRLVLASGASLALFVALIHTRKTK